MKINNISPIIFRYCTCTNKVSDRLKPVAFLSCLKVLILVLPVLFFSCAGTQKQKSLFASGKNMSHLLVDRTDKFEAAGDIAVSSRGGRYRGKMSVTIKEGDIFSCDLYSPFGQIVASFTSDKDSARIGIGELEYRVGINDNLSFVPFLMQYPFIFSDLIRILTGRIYKSNCFSTEADSVWRE